MGCCCWKKWGVLCSLVLLLCACKEAPKPLDFLGNNMTGIAVGQNFSLTDFNGQHRTLQDFHGKVVLIFFGYTRCPEVCPTTMGELMQTMRALGPDADQVQVLFVSLDPTRDSLAALKAYTASFDPRFLGLTGSETEIAETAKAFKVVYKKVPDASGTDYGIDHSAGTYLYDRQGELRGYVKYGSGAKIFTHDVRELLQQ